MVIPDEEPQLRVVCFCALIIDFTYVPSDKLGELMMTRLETRVEIPGAKQD